MNRSSIRTGNLLAFHVSAMLRLAFQEEADRPGLPAVDRLVQLAFGVVDQALGNLVASRLEIFVDLDPVVIRVPADVDGLAGVGYAPGLLSEHGKKGGLLRGRFLWLHVPAAFRHVILTPPPLHSAVSRAPLPPLPAASLRHTHRTVG